MMEAWIKDEEMRVRGHCFFCFSSHWIGLHLITESEFVYTHMNGCDGCLTYPPPPPFFCLFFFFVFTLGSGGGVRAAND